MNDTARNMAESSITPAFIDFSNTGDEVLDMNTALSAEGMKRQSEQRENRRSRRNIRRRYYSKQRSEHKCLEGKLF
jgi:hypothetical protein